MPSTISVQLSGYIALVVLAACLFSACYFRRNIPLSNRKKVVSLYANVPPNIDAKFGEKEWEFARSVRYKGADSDRELISDNEVEVHTAWDESNLYMIFNVTDNNLQSYQTTLDHSRMSKDDIVEFLIDANNDKDSCWSVDDIIYHINLNNQKKDDRGTINCESDSKWTGNAKTAVRFFGTLNDPSDKDTGYVVEVALPWNELNLKPASGMTLGIDFASGDGGIFFDWSGAKPFRSPYAFGDLILKR